MLKSQSMHKIKKIID